ncbi:MAG: hypothetical protein MK085_03305 [Phycisphaerales bacterium]|nr:hypothetical protein [Phycisphaerales bacterium]
MSSRPGSVVLFTAFEPSGDAHAAPLVAALRAKAPDMRIFAWGGPKMEAAGAEMMGQTCDDGSMGLGGFAAAMSVHKTIREIRRWAAGVPLVAHVPVDSPAANFPICKTMRKRGVRVIHLVAPQLWAWGGWRVRKLRRLTDMVMCLLPFEEEWFRSRSVPARFIGHPVMEKEIDEAAMDAQAAAFPQGSPRILILPGSRSAEIRANLSLLVRTFVELRNRNSRTAGVVVASNDAIARDLRKRLSPMPGGLHLTAGAIEPAIHWADMALTVSGTVSLDLTRQATPMVGVYRVGPISWLGSKLLLKTPHRLLPNIVAGDEVVPEFVPYLGMRGTGPIVHATTQLVSDKRALAQSAAALAHVRARFENHDAHAEASEIVLDLLGRGEKKAVVDEPSPSEPLPGDEGEQEPARRRRTMTGFSPAARALEGEDPLEADND